MTFIRPGPTAQSPLTLASLRDRIEALENLVTRLLTQRTPQQIGMSDLTNADGMGIVIGGHAPTWNNGLGGFGGQPNDAIMEFHGHGQPGLGIVSAGHSRYACAIVSLSAAMSGSDGTSVQFALLVNGVSKGTFVINAVNLAPVAFNPVIPINAYTDVIEIQVLSTPSASNSNLHVYVERGGQPYG